MNGVRGPNPQLGLFTESRSDLSPVDTSLIWIYDITQSVCGQTLNLTQPQTCLLDLGSQVTQ